MAIARMFPASSAMLPALSASPGHSGISVPGRATTSIQDESQNSAGGATTPSMLITADAPTGMRAGDDMWM